MSLLDILKQFFPLESGRDTRIWLRRVEDFWCKSFFQRLVDSNEFSELNLFNSFGSHVFLIGLKFLPGWSFMGINACNVVQKKYPDMMLLLSWCVMHKETMKV